MAKVGIITFHASYNFGSVMQAWATQKTVEHLGHDVEIINFRMQSQKDKYSLFPLHSGMKTIIRNLLQLRHIGKKYRANTQYEDFICNKLNITEEYATYEQLLKMEQYDIYLAGSDQIWGYAIPEFMFTTEDVRGIYYFGFTDGYKISYASSTGEATYEQLQPYKKYMEQFSNIAVREQHGKKLIGDIIGKKVECVLDPTYLISHEEWVKISKYGKKVCDEKYILIYSLQGRKKAKKFW